MSSVARMPQKLPPFSPFSPGLYSTSQISSGKRTFHFDVVIEATVTIGTADATAVLNGGSLASLFERIGIDENGTYVVDWPATMMHALTKVTAANSGSDVNLTDVAQGTYNLRTLIRIPMKWPWGKAAETSYIEADPSQNTFLFLKPASDLSTANGYLVAPGASGTAAITNLTVTAYQDYDDQSITSPPWFVPHYDTLSQAISSSADNVPFYLRTNSLLRGVMLETQNNDGTYGNLLTNANVTQLRLLDDLRNYIGEPKVSPLHLQMFEQLAYGGDVIGVGADTFVDWQRWGFLSKVYNPARNGNNLRFEVDQVVPGGTSANVALAGLIKLVRINGRTAPGLPAGMDGI